jgi:GTP-binding protein HflX
VHELTGNLTGLKPSEVKALERIYRRRIPPSDVVTNELAGYMCTLSRDIERQVGLLASRRGDVEHVFVGDASRIFVPEFGRLRAGRGRFRGLRLVHTHLRNEALTRDDLVDLALLRLDLVAAVGVTRDGRPADLYLAHLLPPRENAEPWAVLPPVPFQRAEFDVATLVTALEEEFERAVPSTFATRGAERALLVVVETGNNRGPGRALLHGTLRGSHTPRDGTAAAEPPSSRRAPIASRVAELRELCRTAGIVVAGVVEQRRPQPDPKYLVGKGKLEDILVRAMQLDAGVFIFDPELTPGQAHAIADFTDLKVLDRTMLILDIFAQRARSRDGKLQVELAQLKYRLPRLQEKNTMMSRLVGGIGGRGPGETKLEINRRRARERIHRLEQEIERYGRQRMERRSQRNQRGVPVVAIVGYTNAGKSTLLNTLTKSEVLAEDKLFATLDPTTRRLRLLPPYSESERLRRSDHEVVIADTVGFIRDLPRDLARAFRATLEELNEADLLVHLVDAADPDHEQQVDAVERILAELGLGETRRILVLNKIDLLPPEDRARLQEDPGVVAISAQDARSAAPLLSALQTAL